MQSAEMGLVHFSYRGAGFLARETWNCRDTARTPAREELASPAAAVRLADSNLISFIEQLLMRLEVDHRFRPWINLDDLAHILARRQEALLEIPESVEEPEFSEDNARSLHALVQQCADATLRWFDKEYAPKKGYNPQTREGLRAAFLDHVTIIVEDQNNPGHSVLVRHRLTHLSPAEFHASQLRSDFQWICKRFGEAVRSAILQEV